MLLVPSEDAPQDVHSLLARAGFDVVLASEHGAGVPRHDASAPGDDAAARAQHAGTCEFDAIVIGAREHASGRHPPGDPQSVVVVLASTDDELERALLLGADAGVVLPCALAVLTISIRQAVAHARAEAELGRALGDLAACKRLASAGDWRLDPGADVLEVSVQARVLLGMRDGDRPSARAHLAAAVHPDDRPAFERWLESAAASPSGVEIEHRLASDAERRVRQCARRVEGTGGLEITGFVGALDPRRSAWTAKRATIDGRGAALERISLALPRSGRDSLAVLLVDVGSDGPEADEGRATLAIERTREIVRNRDLFGRTMRDLSLTRVSRTSFALVLPGLTHAQAAYEVARRIEDELAILLDRGDRAAAKTAIGVAVRPADGTTPEALLASAEQAVAACAGGAGRRIRFHDPALDTHAREQGQIESGLRNALERGELSVHYQPRIEIATDRIVCFEALVRWTHPELGPIPPARFIPVAERIDVIGEIGEFVLRTACAQNRRWQDAGLLPVRVAVNLSSLQFRDPELARNVRRTLSEVGLEPRWLELELTESLLLEKIESTIEILVELKELGIRVAIDDFGTGYSSLAYLKRFPVDTIKIDQSFIRDLTTSREDAAITTSILLMGKSLGLEVVAEGVETANQLGLLRLLECDEAQGYYFSRPVPAEQAGALLAASLVAQA